MTATNLAARLLPEPQHVELREGCFALSGTRLAAAMPGSAEHEASRQVLGVALRAGGASVTVRSAADAACRFDVGDGCDLPELPQQGYAHYGYSLAIGPKGISAKAASPTGLLYAAQTLRQLVRIYAEERHLPCLSIVDWPEFRMRGIYVEGGQERFGRIVAKDYLCEQIRRLSEFKMNTLVVECYNLFPFDSFPQCADAGTLTRKETRAIIDEAKRWHVTIVPSLQTLAQSYELVWLCDAGKPYREVTAPGQMCPSEPAIYPFIKGLYRDLLTLFDDSPIIGVGCSEIEMQWQGRYCPNCQARIAKGETVRDLLLGHADKCIQAVHEVADELKRPIRPLMWGDEFYMYGPGHDWVGMDRIPRDTVMGFWKYWRDYKGIGGLMQRGYDVLGISAMYNHTFYLADLTPEDPHKSWPSMEETGTRNIAELVEEAARASRSGTNATHKPEFWGVATASFSKHRLRAFDSIWYGFALNGQCTWSRPERTVGGYQTAFTRAFVRHYYDCRTDVAVEALASAWERLDRSKSALELANQTLHDVVGTYDTQEAGYQGNSLMGALRECRKRLADGSEATNGLATIRKAALAAAAEARAVEGTLLASARPSATRREELDDLRLAARKIAAHADRQVLLIDTERKLTGAPFLPTDLARSGARVLRDHWRAARTALRGIAKRDARLYTRGDPCGHAALLSDIDAVIRHLGDAYRQTPARVTDTLLEEPFERLDPARWLVLGKPRVAGGRLDTLAPGGWDNRCGIATRQVFDLSQERPLLVEFTLKPIKLGVDSQIFASANAAGIDSFQFTFYASRDRFAIHTQAATVLAGPWTDASAGWHQRALSAPVEAGKEYRIRAEIRRSSFRVTVREAGDTDWGLPFWDSGQVPMDPLDTTRLRWADVEPDGATAASSWGPIRIYRTR